jgi:hypothetical protein
MFGNRMKVIVPSSQPKTKNKNGQEGSGGLLDRREKRERLLRNLKQSDGAGQLRSGG